jgi:hypothetical protein
MHTVTEIEEKIRRRYHQPKGVEQFGIEPVPPELKTVRWYDIFAIIFGFALNPRSMLVGGMAVVSGLSFWGAIGAITGGGCSQPSPTRSPRPSASTTVCRAKSRCAWYMDCVARNGCRRSCARLLRPTGLPTRPWRARSRSSRSSTVGPEHPILSSPSEWIRVLVTLLATGASYWATMQLLSPRFTELARASHPGEQREAVEDLDWELALR